jgi:hypothetical protein
MKYLRAFVSLAICLVSSGSAYPYYTPPTVDDYGAVGNGVTDDTAAFNACLANNALCWVPPSKTYAVAGVTLNSGNQLVGAGVVEYGADTASTTHSKSILVLSAAAGAKNIINAAGVKDGAALNGLFLDCHGSNSASGVSGGSFQLTVNDVTVVNCAAGLGDATYSSELHISNSTFGGNSVGVENIIDSFIVNGDFSNNSGDGVYLGAGSNDNTIVNTRFEWNQGYGIESYGGSVANMVANCLFDRNYEVGVRLVGDGGMTLSNNMFTRNGRNGAPPDQNAQIYLSGSKNTSITGGVSLVGQDDGGKGPLTPAYVFSFDPATPSTNVTISGFATSGLYNASSNTNGSFTTAAVEGAEPVSGYNVSGVNDIPATATAISGITAYAGGGQSSATPLTATINTVTSVASSSASVKLAKCIPGRQQTVINASTNAMQVFGSSPDTINLIATATGLSQPGGKTAIYVCAAAGAWARLLSN